ncbi:hypothetical protein D3C81_401100 [compost metagenome]
MSGPDIARLPGRRTGGGSLLVPLALRNLRLLASYNWLAALLMLAVMAAVSNAAFMGPGEAGLYGERYASLAGLLLLPPLAMLDAGGIGETLLAKRRSHAVIFLLRWLLTAGYAGLLLAVFFELLRLMGADFALPLAAGVWITTVALGSFGLLLAVLFRHLAGGFIAAFAWYLIDWMSKGKYTGPFYLFSMQKGAWNDDKLWLLGLALCCAAVTAWLLPRSLGTEDYR